MRWGRMRDNQKVEICGKRNRGGRVRGWGIGGIVLVSGKLSIFLQGV